MWRSRLPSELIVFPDGKTYRRSGECDGCATREVRAACCRYVFLPKRALNQDEQHWLSLHNLPNWTPRERRIEAECSALEADGKCALFGKPERPQLCINYPELPGLDDGCSYNFEEIA